MYINNLTGKPIKDISFDGFWFTIPAGVSIAWDKFAQFLFGNIYKIEGEGVGGGVPPVVVATAEQWKGLLYVEVRRFELNSELVPKRDDLIKIGKKRGIDAATIEEWKEDDTIDIKEIAAAINDLAVPDDIKFPPATGTQSESSIVTEAADEMVNQPAPVKTEVAPEPKAPESKPVAPATGSPKTTRKAAAPKKAAAKAPKTPKAPAK